ERVLEVGNVLPHYFQTRHTVVDKDEADPRVVSSDIVEFQPAQHFDLIVSISTLEHVGFDYSETVQPEKILGAIEHLRGLLSDRGRLLVTLPMGYNPYLDDLLRNGVLRFDRTLAMERISHDNQWRETDWEGIAHAQYGDPYRGANGLFIGIIGVGGATDLPGLGR
ncbi:MAG: hypothetical protein WAL38_28940, partial [Solirubrobacteraceae bacterium]